MPTKQQPLVGDVSANFLRIEECRVVRASDPFGRNLGFLVWVVVWLYGALK
jgi:hypothetical protein